MKHTALELFFRARSVAVIGASVHREKVGYQILHNLLKSSQESSHVRYQRKLFPINPTASSILGQKCFPSIMAITEPIDMVIIVTPVGTVRSLVDEVIERNRILPKTQRVSSVIIISAGFAETDEEGRQLQQLITTKLLLAGVRLLGPNTLGLIHTGYFLNASFAQQEIATGNLAVISQSGAMLTALFNSLASRQAGISFAVSLGNKADLNENDCLQYAIDDPHTSAVILYLESFFHLPVFFELVSQLRRHKPVILLKGGTSARGQVASTSHTAALATNQALLTAAAAQFGFTLVENMEELMNVAFFLAHHRQLPTNTMVITNAGGPAVNTIDELARHEVTLAKWSSRAQADLTQLLPKIKPANPLDLLGDADPLRFKVALEVAQRDPDIESMIAIVTPQAVTDIPAIIEQIIAMKGKKPIFVVLMGGDQLEKYRQHLRHHQFICAAFSNDVVDMLNILSKTAQTRYLPFRYVLSTPHTPTNVLQQIQATQTHQQLASQAGFSQDFVHQPHLTETFHLLKKQGFKLPKFWIVSAENLDQLKALPYPVFVKTANLTILHKKKMGAVYGVVRSQEEAQTAFIALKKFGEEVLYQELINIEHELLVGIENDPQFGMYMTVGLGGSYTNLLADRAYCFLPAPISMLKRAWLQTKAAQLFNGHPELSLVILENLERLQKLMMQYPWIRSLEINPLAVSQGNLWVVDIKLQV